MKRLLSLLVSFVLVIGPVGAVFAQASLKPAAQAPSQPVALPPPPEVTTTAPGGTGIENIGSSTLANVTPADPPIGAAFDLCFTVYVQSPDAEYLDHFEVDLPNNRTINSVAPNSVPPANGCSSALPPVVGVSAGNVVYWQSTGYPPHTGCGAWNGGSSGTNFDFCANVTIPDTSGAPWMLPWNYIGDGWGSTPHQVSGSYGPIGPVSPIMLTPAEINTEGCPYEPQEHQLTVWNNTGADTNVNLSYTIVAGGGDCDGPDQVFVANGANLGITVDLYPVGNPGNTVICEIYAANATNPANNDTSWIHKTLISGGFDPAGWQLEPIAGATGNQWAGNTVGTHPAATGEVGYIVGGLGVGSNTPNPDLQMYNPATGAWTQLADMPNWRFSPVVGWIGGLLYAAGGYDAAFAATNDLQVYNPATNTWDNTTYTNLPNPRGGGAGGVGVCSSGTGECLFHVGGGPDSSFANTTLETWQYNPGANAWTQLDNKPAGSSPDGFFFGAGVGCMGRIYVGGDYRGFHEFYRLDATQPAGSQWSQLANIPAGAGAMTPALVCKPDMGAILLIGGDPDGYWGTYNTTVYVYDIASNTWSGPLPQTLHVGQLGSVAWHMAGAVWTAGGTVGSWAITPMPFESLDQSICQTQPSMWEKFVDGVRWHPGMTITRQTSDTIVVQEVLHLDPAMLPLESAPFTPVNVRGGELEGETVLRVHSPAPRALIRLEAPANPDAVLWDQPLSTVNQAAYVNQDFSDYPAYWAISTIFIPGDGWNGFTTLMNASALNWAIYADCAGVPCGNPSGGGNPPAWTLTLPPTNAQVTITNGSGGMPSNTTLNLAAPLNLPPGHWWLLFWPTMPFSPSGQYGRQPSDTTNGTVGQFINPGGGFGYGTAWQNWTVIGPAQQDIAFRLEGDQNPVFAQIEYWNPDHLTLLDWAVDYGDVTVNPGSAIWTGEIVAPMTVTLTKWFHVKAGDWTETMLWEELWLDGEELERRPVSIMHGYLLLYLPVIMRASP